VDIFVDPQHARVSHLTEAEQLSATVLMKKEPQNLIILDLTLPPSKCSSSTETEVLLLEQSNDDFEINSPFEVTDLSSSTTL
jgi:hypothetical protein